jgi:uncharacterized surface protein with fasciclin (FAS1) repeats
VQAFEAALKALGLTAKQLLGDKKLLDAILAYHVVPAVVASSQIKSGQVSRSHAEHGQPTVPAPPTLRPTCCQTT